MGGFIDKECDTALMTAIPPGDNTQSANRADKDWVIDWDTLSSGGRWENGLMGWASSADYMQGK